jgi:hypothetical protein
LIGITNHILLLDEFGKPMPTLTAGIPEEVSRTSSHAGWVKPSDFDEDVMDRKELIRALHKVEKRLGLDYSRHARTTEQELALLLEKRQQELVEFEAQQERLRRKPEREDDLPAEYLETLGVPWFTSQDTGGGKRVFRSSRGLS